MAFQRRFSGAPWEPLAGYCRAVRAGNLIVVSGTAPVATDGSVFAPGKPYEQAKHCLHLIEQTLADFGASLADVVRTRMYVTDIEQWQAFGRAHREAFAEHPPATTMVEVKALIDPAMLIEIEADAVVSDSSPDQGGPTTPPLTREGPRLLPLNRGRRGRGSPFSR